MINLKYKYTCNFIFIHTYFSFRICTSIATDPEEASLKFWKIFRYFRDIILLSGCCGKVVIFDIRDQRFKSHPSFFWTCSSTKKVYIEKGRKRLHLFKAFIILFKTASTSFSSWTPFPTSRWITFSICFRSLKRAPFPLPALSLQFQTEFRLGNILFGWLFCLYMLLKRCVISKLLSARNYL